MSSQTNDHIKVEPGVNFTFEDPTKKKVKKSGGDFNLNPKLVYKNVGKENFVRTNRELVAPKNEADETEINVSKHQGLLTHKT